MEYRFKIGDVVVTNKGMTGTVVAQSVYEDHDGYDDNGPIILHWKYYDVRFDDGTIETIAERKLRHEYEIHN